MLGESYALTKSDFGCIHFALHLYEQVTRKKMSSGARAKCIQPKSLFIRAQDSPNIKESPDTGTHTGGEADGAICLSPPPRESPEFFFFFTMNNFFN